MKLKIRITKEILEKSKMCGILNNDPYHIASNCAVALACREIFPKCHVGIGSIRPEGKYDFVDEILIPKAATDFIRKFDSLYYAPEKRTLLPELEFEIEISDRILEHINTDQVKEVLKNSTTLELIATNI